MKTKKRLKMGSRNVLLFLRELTLGREGKYAERPKIEKPIYAIVIVLFLLSNSLLSYAQHQSRKTLLFDKDWLFKAGVLYEDSFDDSLSGLYKLDVEDSNWEKVTLPHDAAVSRNFSKKLSTQQQAWLPYGNGWYRKHFTLKKADKNRFTFVNFEGVYRDASIYINGHYLGNHLNGYLGFQYDLTPYLKYGEDNVIAVRYDNSHKETSRWYTGEGIYRDVYLIQTDSVFIPKDGTYITTPEVSKEKSVVKIRTEVKNGSEIRRDVKLVTTILDANNKLVAQAVAVAPISTKETFTFTQRIPVQNTKLWDCEHPHLYHANSKIYIGSQQIDYAEKTGGFRLADNYTTRFGFRTIEMRQGEGMFLNGKRIIAKGGDIHDNLGPLGSVALKAGYIRNYLKMKEMGCNSVRLSHNPQSPLLLNLADSLGFLVYDEAYDKWTSQYYGGKFKFETQWKRDLTQFIKRDRNHPSVYIWSMGNEVLKQKGMQDKCFKREEYVPDYGVSLFKQMKALAKQLDPTRAVTVALLPAREKVEREKNKYTNHDEFMHSRPSEMAFYSDVVSYNYTENNFITDTKRYPQMLFIASETGTNLGFPYRHNSWLELNKQIIGHYYWTAMDYLGESVWPSKSWGHAFFDITGMQTPLGYLYESFYKEKPLLKIYTYQKSGKNKAFFDQTVNKRWSWYPLIRSWNWEKKETVRVQALTNADEVELYLNGKSLGAKKMATKVELNKLKDHSEVVEKTATARYNNGSKELASATETHLDWSIAYKEGMLTAVARKNGVEVATDTLRTTSKIASISLDPETKTLKSNGRDLCYIRVRLLDKQGILVTNKDMKIHFNVTGPAVIAGVGNGDIFSDESWVSDQRMTYQGTCLLILRSTYKKGDIQITAKSSQGLHSILNIKGE